MGRESCALPQPIPYRATGLQKLFIFYVLALALCQTSCAQWSTPEEVPVLKEHFMMGAAPYASGLLSLTQDKRNGRIMLVERRDEVWSEPQPLSFVPDSSRDVSLFVSSGGVTYVGWRRRSHDIPISRSATDEVWVARRVGTDWETPYLLHTVAPEGFNFSYPISFAETPDGSVHAVFGARPDATSSVLRSRYDGETWTEPDVICQECGAAALDVDRIGRLVATYLAGASLNGAYDANSVFFTASAEDGSWETPMLVSRSGRERGQNPKILTAPDGRLLLIWRKETLNSSSNLNFNRIWLTESSDGGRTWVEPREIRGDAGGFFLKFDAAIDGAGILHLVGSWTSADYYTGRLYAYKWKNGTLEGPLRLGTSEAAGLNALTVMPSGRLQLFWGERLSCDATYCVFRMMEMSRAIAAVQSAPPPEPPGKLALSLPTPNPAFSTARFTISLGTAPNATLLITDLLGRVIEQTHLPRANSSLQVVDVDVGALAAGVYLARLVSATGSQTRPFFVGR